MLFIGFLWLCFVIVIFSPVSSATEDETTDNTIFFNYIKEGEFGINWLECEIEMIYLQISIVERNKMRREYVRV